jgi:hypothetical protein
MRSPGDSVRQQIVSHPYLACLMVGVVLASGLFHWYYCWAGLFLIGAVLVMSYRGRLRRQNAGHRIVPGTWSLRVILEKVYVSQDGTTVSLNMSDLERIAAKRVRNAKGSPTEWTALCARVSRGHAVQLSTYDQWLPLVWLTTKRTTNDYRRLPQLLTAIRWFPDALLGYKMTDIKRANATEYSASGVLAEPPVPWTNSVLPSFAVSLLLFIFGQSGLGSVCLLCCLVLQSRFVTWGQDDPGVSGVALRCGTATA